MFCDMNKLPNPSPLFCFDSRGLWPCRWNVHVREDRDRWGRGEGRFLHTAKPVNRRAKTQWNLTKGALSCIKCVCVFLCVYHMVDVNRMLWPVTSYVVGPQTSLPFRTLWYPLFNPSTPPMDHDGDAPDHREYVGNDCIITLMKSSVLHTAKK